MYRRDTTTSGSHVVLGKFQLSRDVKLLDLGALSRVFANSSYFEPAHGFKKAKTAFIRCLVSEISRPVMPRDVDREYLPTQFVASYLAHRAKPNLDGIIFPSSQTSDDEQNVALFNHARRVDPYELPQGSETEVFVNSSVDEEDDDDIFISETLPSVVPGGDSLGEEGQRGPVIVMDYDNREEDENSVPPTLKLDMKSIEVRAIKSVKFGTRSRSVSRHQQTKGERDSHNLGISGPISFNDF